MPANLQPPDTLDVMTAPSRRDQMVVVIAIVIGASLIAATLRVPRNGTAFYACGFAAAAVWIGAAWLCRPIHWIDSGEASRDLAIGVAVGGAMFGVFVLGAEIGRHISLLAGPIDSVLRKADGGSTAFVITLALVSGVAEELFFRGALLAVLPARHAAVVAVVVYVAVTAAAGNTALTIAAIVMGAVFAVERAVTGALAASITTHVVWSTLMILALPR
jgi:uncharacterized protein